MTNENKIGRNELCPCGSGKKYKNCHINIKVEMPDNSVFNLAQLEIVKKAFLGNVKKHVEIYKKEGMLKHYPNHEDLLKKMVQAIHKASNAPIKGNPHHISGGQIFQRVHESGLGDLLFAWSIPVLDEVVNNHNLKTRTFNVSELMDYIDVSALDPNTLQSAASNNIPIYVIEYQALKVEQWAADGNHRIASRYNANKMAKIEGYYLPPELHMQALMYDFMRVAYAVRTNIIRAYDYQGGYLPTMLSME